MIPFARFVLSAIATGVLVSGCASSVGMGGGPLAHYASVKINSGSVEAIQQETINVFSDNGFMYVPGGYQTLKFRKEGNSITEMMWSDLGNDNPIFIEATVTMAPDGIARYRLTCDVELMQQGPLGASTKSPMLSGRLNYQSLLNQIKKRVENRPL